MKRVRCLFHQEKTQSLVRYKDHWYCYGACNKKYTIEEVAAKGVTADYEGDSEYDQEDVRNRCQQIKSLPEKEIRGFKFHADAGGYYILWPGDAYWKYRKYHGEPKYIGAKAPKPLFVVRMGAARTLCITEGEVNSMSVARAMPEWDVVSPSSTTKFTDQAMSKHLTTFRNYASLVVVLDADSAGDKAETKMRIFFRSNGIPFVHYVRLTPDANDILVQQGKESLRHAIENQMRFGL